jgi:hypothetical protein
MPDWSGLEIGPVKRHLEWRGNLEGLFADRIVLIEGNHDENFYEKLRHIFSIRFPPKKFTLFVKTSGRKQLRIVRDFYLRMGFEDVAAVGDLDYVFSGDIKRLLEEFGLDPTKIDALRAHIGWAHAGDPSLEDVLIGVQKAGVPADFESVLGALEKHRIFVLRHGAPEHYCKNGAGRKGAWVTVNSEADLLEVGYLKSLMVAILS